ncbi:MAG: enoyl-CoA hydratase [Streptosporangiales bacterium]|nr:enoyl-CoA hydratase [Streptosporangiales bacterium]
MKVAELAGTSLGTRTVSYDERDALLYAVATGAPADQLDLVYERDLRVLPTFGLTLGLWAVEAAGDLGAYDRMTSLHAAQRTVLHRPLPKQAKVEMSATVDAVWDKGKAALVDIRVDSEWFTSTYAIFLPGLGGWGGERGASGSPPEPTGPATATRFATSPEQAVLYRLTGDDHPVHVDPEVAHGYGFGRPILHGLCTLAVATRLAAGAVGAHPADVRAVDARLAAPVLPGDELTVSSAPAGNGTVVFDAAVADTSVLKNGYASFG